MGIYSVAIGIVAKRSRSNHGWPPTSLDGNPTTRSSSKWLRRCVPTTARANSRQCRGCKDWKAADTLAVGDVSITIYRHESLTSEQVLDLLVKHYKAWSVNRPGGRL